MKARSIAIGGALAGCAALLPYRAFAACGVQDLGACVDDAQYTFWYGLAGLGWALDRTLLMLAYQLDVFRWWLVEIAFSSAYQSLVTLIGPLLVPIATLAIVIGCLGFLLLPLGRVELVKLRHALVWSALAPLLLTLSGPLLVQIEQARSDLGNALFTGASQLAPGAIFGAAAGDMQLPAPLYPSNPCGAPLDRRNGAAGLRMDDLAAAMLWADAEDIHCPDRGGPGPDIPDAFYEAAPGGPGYATEERVGLMDDAAMRSAAIANMQRGAVRLFLGLLPATLAALDALVQLVFALCLVALWIGLPIGLVFVFFQQTAGGVTGLFRRAVTVLQVSWSSSVVLGIVFACLLASANLRNAAAYTGFAIGALALTGYILATAVDTLKDSIRTLNDTVAVATGLSVTRPFEMAGSAATGALTLGAAAATGGAAMALTAAAAQQQTGNSRYAAAAAVGRIRPIAQVGEVAALMGALDPQGEIASGLYAGQRSAHSLRAARLQMTSDARRTDDAGRTFRDQAMERQVTHDLARAERPTVLQELGTVAHGGQRFVNAFASGQVDAELARMAQTIPSAIAAGWQRMQSVRQELAAEIDARTGGDRPLGRVVATAQVLDERLHPHGERAVFALDSRGRLQAATMAPQEIPANAMTEPRERLNLPRLLVLGYAVQERRDGSVAFWRTTPVAPQRTEADERRFLLQAGALLGEVAAAHSEPRAAHGQAAAPSPAAASPQSKRKGAA